MTDNWITNIQKELLNVSYHHLIFQVVNRSIMFLCEEEVFKPATTAEMHTFGNSLEFHPHIHILPSKGGISNDSAVWRERILIQTGVNPLIYPRCKIEMI